MIAAVQALRQERIVTLVQAVTAVGRFDAGFGF